MTGVMHPRTPATERHGDSVSAFPNPPPAGRLEALRAFLDAHGAPPYRFRQISDALHQGRVARFEDLHALPASLRTALTDHFGSSIVPLRLVAVQRADAMEKALFETTSGARFESVLTRYRRGWTSLCVSSQAGCGLGCTFCATGAVGLRRNLSVDEIHGQVVHPVWRGHRPDSVAFMGMGEALANPRLLDALNRLRDTGFSPRRITVSTVGLAPRLRQLTTTQPQVTVTLSVHSPFPDQRAELIPLERRYPLAENLDVLDRHVVTSRRKAYLAYLLIDGVNDSSAHATELARLVRARARPELFHVSLIAYNPATGADPTFAPPSRRTVDAFLAQLRASGVRATRRRQAGAEVDSACGQLHARYLGDGRASTLRAERA